MGKKSAKQVTNFLGTSALTRPLFALGAASVLFGTGPAHALDANTLPQNPNVVGGKDSFSQSGSTLNVNQQTNRTVIDWRSFDIGSKAQVNFNQPGTSSIAVNRVNGSTNPSDIEGGLHANGQVWILNPNGVFFGKSARVDAAGIVATTANINDKAFMAGSNKLQMTGADHGSVVNEGRVTVGQNGLAAFVAPSVRNSGTINATVGRVALAAGTTYTLDLAGDHLVELGLGSVKAVVDNTGKIVNPGGTIALTAKAAGQVVNSVVNVSGTVSASSATTSGGTIILGADTVNTTKTASITADAGTNGTGGTITSVANVQGNYAGSFSAKGGSKSGDGGKIETSGHDVALAAGLKVSASAVKGNAGQWKVDPTDLNIDSSGAATIALSLSTGTSVDLSTASDGTDAGDITLSSSINTTTMNGADLTLEGHHLFATGGSTISLTGAGSTLTLDVNTVGNTSNPSGNWINDALGMIGSVTGGSTINLGAGTYSAGTTINKNDVTLNGSAGAKIAVGTGQTGVTIDANNVTVENIEFAGPLTQAYMNYTWSGVGDPGNSWAIQVTHATNSNFNIENNNIHDVRTGILIANSGNPATGAASGAITGNTFDNTKGGVIVQYRDGSTVNISGNRSGTTGNEWGVVYNTNLNPAIIATTASSSRQAALLAVANANTGLAVLDRGYTYANRTSVTVDDNATGTPDNGYGNARQPLATIQAGIDAVVSGGTVNVLDGTYTISSGYINVNKSLNLIGQSEAGVIIDARNASTYGLRVTATDGAVDLENFTLYGVTASGGYGLKAEATNGLTLENITSQGAYKSEFDLNGVLNGTLDHLLANGYSVGTTTMTGGNGISFTNSQNITLTNSVTENNGWGGLALYQGTTYGNLQLTGITVNGSNTFNEANGIYAEDQSAATDIGTVNLSGQGITYVAQGLVAPNDFYTWFRTSKQGAIDAAAAVRTVGYVEGYAGNVSGDGHFYVGVSTGGTAMSIQAAINAAASGAEINVDAGTYTDALNIGKNVDIEGAGAGQTIIQPTALLTTGVGHKYDSNVKTAVYVHDASDVTINGVTIDANNLGANAVVFWNNASGTISNAIIENPMAFSGVQTGQGIAVDATSGHTTNLTVDGVTFQNWNKNAIDAVTGDGTGTNGGTINLTVTDSDFIGRGNTGTIAQNGILAWEQGGGTVNAMIDNDSFSGLSFSDPNVATATGVLVYGSANGTVVVENSTFASSVQEYISTAGGSPNEVDATNGNTFGGVAIRSATLNQLYAIEDKITDGTDDSSNGLVRLVAGHVYATAQKDNLQAAVDVASIGDTINVQAGTYTSALDIDKNVDIEGAGAGQTIIQPTALLTTGVGHKYDSNVKTAVYVHDASDVTLNGLTIDANNLGANAVVFWNNASGTISNAIIENPMAFSGAQTGQGIAVDATGANTTDLTVDNVTFQNWNKNAIDAVTGDGTGTNGGTINLTVTDSDFIGRGDTGTIAQNGILTWEQGGGTVNATIDGDSFSGLSFNDPNVATATGVLVYGTANGTVTVSNSTFASSVQEYISTAGGSTHEVDATDGNTFGGVAISSATLDEIFAIVDKITDGIDDTSNGLVRLVDGQVYVTAAKGDIAAGVTKAAAGDTVNVQDGSYTLANELDITKRLTLKGESQDGTVITSNSTGYGINVTADDVSLKDFTFNAPTAHTGSTYGIKVTPGTNVASDRLLNFDIENVTINGGYRTGLDLNGVVNATINNVSVSNVQNGNGIALTDSADITLTNVTTTNNAWGGLALYQTNYFYDQQLTDINVDTSNHFNEANGIYIEDQSDGIGDPSRGKPSVVGGSGLDVGTLNIAGYDYVAVDKSNSADQYTFFQKTKQDAIDFATDSTANHNHLTLANTYVEGWTGSALNNIFEVGFNTAGDKSLTIQAAENAATAGGTINVGSGTYAEDVSVGTQLTFNFGDVDVNSFTLTSGAAGSALNGDLTATGAITSAGAVTLSGDFAGASVGLNGAVTLAGDTTLNASGALTVASITGGSHDLELTGGSISLGNVAGVDALTVDDAATLTGTSYAGDSLDFEGAVTLTGNTTMDASGAITVASVTGAGNDLELDGASASLGDVAGVGALVVDSAATLTGTSYDADSLEFDGAVTLTGDTTMDASGAITVASVTGAGHDLELDGASASLGNVAGVGALVVDSAATLTGSSYSADSLEFDGAVTLTDDTTMDASGAVTVASVTGAGNDLEIDGSSISLGNVAGAGALEVDDAATLTGTSYAGNSLTFDGAVTLSGDTTMSASGLITVASVTGASHDLTLDGGSASLGNVAGVDALVVDSAATLTGNSYAANSLEFDGAVTLTHDTTMDASGALTVASVVGAGKDLELDGSSISLGNVAGADVLTVDDAATLTGTSYAGNSLKFNGLVTLTHDTTMTGTNNVTVASVTGGGKDLSIGSASNQLGNIDSVDVLTVTGATKLTGTSYGANDMSFGAVTLTGDTTLNARNTVAVGPVTGGSHDLSVIGISASLANVAGVDALTVNAAATLTGSSYSANSMSFDSLTLAHDAVLTAGGNIATGSVTGGGNDLSLTGAAVSVGNVAGVDALAVTGPATLTGANYAANSMVFGAVSLTHDTAMNATGNLIVTSVAGNNKDLSISGASNALGNVAGVDVLTVAGATTLTGTSYVADAIGFGAITLTGDTTLDASGNVAVASVTGAGNDLSIDGVSNALGNVAGVGALAVTGPVTLTGTSYAANSIGMDEVTLTGDTTLDANGNVTLASITGAGNDLSIDGAANTLGNIAGVGALAVTGPSTLTGTSYAANSAAFGAVTLTGDTTIDAGTIAVASVTGGGNDLTLDGAASFGNVAGVDALAVTGTSTLTGTGYAANSMAFGGAVTLAADATLDATGAVTLASVTGGGNDLTIDAASTKLGNVAGAGALVVDGASTLTGTSYVADSMNFAGAVTLANSVALNTSGDDGAIVLASVDGTSAGGQALNINAGKGKVSLGNLGAAARLGAVTDASATTLTGSTYKANSFLFGGTVTLTAANTTINTTQSSSAAGDITFQGDIFGKTDGGQSLTLIAGSGKGAASANGDITLQNAGTSSVELGNLTVSGDNFTALTVDLAGNFSATLTGNQVFAADTLNVKGNVNSSVGGDASGHIVSGGDVNVAAKGDVSGNISGTNVTLSGDDVNSTVTASNSASVTGNTVEGSYTAQTVAITASDNVDAAVNATNLKLSAANGSVDGTWTNVDTNGSGVVDLNGQHTVGQGDVNPNQLVVEGFTLPSGTTIGANGQLILPQGVLLGLLSPGGGKPKMILVHTVQQLGELLAGGYTVIVIDLSNRDSGKPIQLASN
ncbi:MAG TPA: filamentous hemagglutinin N-terminal domain-containing protein [Rhizomicrobium sp.]